ncbi:MAG: hypothetical protein M3256_08990 [Actinomycetota bacterium]|nr:hypothetical protein [Actinomycetota bacterium]
MSEHTPKVRVGEVRSFDPNRVGHWEWRAWVAYYRREWGMVPLASAWTPRTAARLEVEWWRAHRQRQHGGEGETGTVSIVDALVSCTRSSTAARPTMRDAPRSFGQRRWTSRIAG